MKNTYSFGFFALFVVMGLNNSYAQEVKSRVLDNQTVAFKKEGNNLPRKTLEVGMDSFYDPNVDYSSFSGRITDRDETMSIVKVTSENKNIKFFRAGDLINFRVGTADSESMCQGYVRSIEPDYFVMYIKDLTACYAKDDYFRRGTVLVMNSLKLSERVREASIYRASLLEKKKNFLSQLNNINNGIWNFEERKVKLAAEYDKKIAELEKEKLKALDDLVSRKNDELRLQRELAYRLDNIDFEVDYYRVEKIDNMIDRWHLDHDLGYPVYDRPESVRSTKKEKTSFEIR